MKCQSCRETKDEWPIGWQPFGPDESSYMLTEPGYHYHGFPLIKICADCGEKVERHEVVRFIYKKHWYEVRDNKIIYNIEEKLS